MEKSWVWLPRASLEYQRGASNFVHASSVFVHASSVRLGNPSAMLCPYIDCRNLCHQPIDIVLDHLVIRGMDQKYKRNSFWSLHGDIRTEKPSDDPSSAFEAYDLIRTAFFDCEDNPQPQNHSEDQTDEVDNKEEYDFRKKLEDAETPLYSSCLNYTKVAAIMGLYRIKVKSGMSENYFDQLLTIVADMLPTDNVLPRSTNEMKRFLKMFGFGYDMIHACKNDCILAENILAGNFGGKILTGFCFSGKILAMNL
ncbi:unnamed protein product [Arabidopsis halleri]